MSTFSSPHMEWKQSSEDGFSWFIWDCLVSNLLPPASVPVSVLWNGTLTLTSMLCQWRPLTKGGQPHCLMLLFRGCSWSSHLPGLGGSHRGCQGSGPTLSPYPLSISQPTCQAYFPRKSGGQFQSQAQERSQVPPPLDKAEMGRRVATSQCPPPRRSFGEG